MSDAGYGDEQGALAAAALELDTARHHPGDEASAHATAILCRVLSGLLSVSQTKPRISI